MKKKNLKNLITALMFLLNSSMLSAKANTQSYSEIGRALLEFSIFKIDVYEIVYSKAQDGAEKLDLIYKTDVKKEHSIEGWKKGFSPLLESKDDLEEQLNWVYTNTVDLKKNDTFTIIKDKNETKFLKNNNLVAKSEDQKIAQIILSPWIGSAPIDKEIRNKLLNKSGGPL